MKHRAAKEGYSNQISRDGGRTGTAGTEDEGSGHDEHGRIPAEDGAGRLHSAARPAGVKRDTFPASLHGNNVNQIAKRANEVGVIDEMDIRGVSKRQERMLEQMARLLEKLSGLN